MLKGGGCWLGRKRYVYICTSMAEASACAVHDDSYDSWLCPCFKHGKLASSFCPDMKVTMDNPWCRIMIHGLEPWGNHGQPWSALVVEWYHGCWPRSLLPVSSPAVAHVGMTCRFCLKCYLCEREEIVRICAWQCCIRDIIVFNMENGSDIRQAKVTPWHKEYPHRV